MDISTIKTKTLDIKEDVTYEYSLPNLYTPNLNTVPCNIVLVKNLNSFDELHITNFEATFSQTNWAKWKVLGHCSKKIFLPNQTSKLYFHSPNDDMKIELIMGYESKPDLMELNDLNIQYINEYQALKPASGLHGFGCYISLPGLPFLFSLQNTCRALKFSTDSFSSARKFGFAPYPGSVYKIWKSSDDILEINDILWPAGFQFQLYSDTTPETIFVQEYTVDIV